MKSSPSIFVLTAISIAFTVATAAQPPTIQSVSTTDRPHAAGAGGSFLPVVSADGRFVAFVSPANNLVLNDDLAPWLDVFVRELATDRTELVSVNRTGTGGGDANAHDVAISANGQFVAFATAAGNLVPGDTNGASDVFLRDLSAGTTTLISVDSSGRSPVNAFPLTNHPLSSLPQVSADGRWVLFESLATNLVALPDTNNQPDLFLRDVLAGVTHLVSVNTNGTASGNGASGMASFSPEGRFVAFISTATDLAPGVTNRTGDVYVRDLADGRTTWASINVWSHLWPEEPYRCFHPVVSADGRFVAFKVFGGNETRMRLLHHDVPTGQSVLLATSFPAATWPQISADGRFVAFEQETNVVLWDRDVGASRVISVSGDGSEAGSGTAHSPALTPDGAIVAFLSNATNLVAGVTNGTWQVYWRDWSNGVTRVASLSQYNQPGSVNLDLVAPALSADGRLVVFESTDDSLVANDLNLASDVFVRDMLADTTRLVSARHPALPPATGVALSAVEPLAVSSNGAVIGFTSLDGTLAPYDTNGWQDAFVRNVATGIIEPLSRDPNGGFSVSNVFARAVALSADGQVAAFLWSSARIAGTTFSIARPGYVFWRRLGTGFLLPVNVNAAGELVGGCYSPAITPDGRCVLFSLAGYVNELIPGGSGGHSFAYNIYLRDMLAGTNALVSMTLAGAGLYTYDLQSPTNFVLSPNGRWVLFDTPQANLTTNNVAGVNSLFARDLWNAATLLVSVGPDGQSNWGYATGAVFSGDSRHVAFVSTNGLLTVHDLDTQTSQVVRTNATAPSLSRDGRWVAYQVPADGTGPTNIWISDATSGETRLVSRNLSGGGGNGDSRQPLVSGDGRWVVFASRANDLAPGDNNGASDVFARDLWLNTTLLVSQNRFGTGSGNSLSDRPALAANGRTVVFQSFANDLVAGDYNDRRDVFVLTLPGQDTDGDDLDDDWELAYFDSLTHNGAADSDGDGWTDRVEFRAGTDPTNRGSILRVLTLTAPGSGSITVLWSAVPGRLYRVQFKDGLESGPWTDLAGPVAATTTTGSAVDRTPAAAGQRFYRVVLEP